MLIPVLEPQAARRRTLTAIPSPAAAKSKEIDVIPCGGRFVSASSVGSHTDTSWQAGQAAFADAWLWCSWCRPRTFTYPFCHSAFSEYRSGVGSTGYPTYWQHCFSETIRIQFSVSTEHTAGGKPAMRLHTAGASTPSAEMDGSCVAELT